MSGQSTVMQLIRSASSISEVRPAVWRLLTICDFSKVPEDYVEDVVSGLVSGSDFSANQLRSIGSSMKSVLRHLMADRITTVSNISNNLIKVLENENSRMLIGRETDLPLMFAEIRRFYESSDESLG